MITGGCACGAIRYQSDGAPQFSVFCHCRDCQKASGSDGVPVMGVAREGFKVTGEPARYVTRGGSQKDAIRYFCPACGSLLFGSPQVIPDTITIYVGSLDDPTAFAPQLSMFVRDRPAWGRIAAGLPEFATVPQ